MFVRVDRVKCLSNGQCAAVAPSVFELSTVGQLEYISTPISEDTDMQLERAARLCPTAAITLDRDAATTNTAQKSEGIS